MSAEEGVLVSGERIDGYVIEKVLGQGGTGTVYAARSSDGRAVAVKVLRRMLADDPTARSRFAREVDVLKTLQHSAVVPVLERGALPDGRPYLVMPLLRGQTLASAIASRRTPWNPIEAWEILRPIVEALEAAHTLGVVHRDVKPDNIFLEESNDGVVARLMDFGVAKVSAQPNETSLTRTGSVIGTPAYMSPEQWWGQEVHAATDQYALGVTVWELLALRRPFEKETFAALMQEHLSSPVPSLRAAVGESISKELDAFACRCLQKEQSQRFASMKALIDAGDACFGRSEKAAQTSTKQRSTRLPALLLALGFPLLLVGAGYTGSHDPRFWMHVAGWGAWPILLYYGVGLVVLTVASPHGLGRFIPVLPLMITGWFGAMTGFHRAEQAVRQLPVTRQFVILNLGFAEANANRFMAAGLGSALVLGALALDPAMRGDGSSERKKLDILSVSLLVLGVIAALSNVWSGALVCVAAAIAHGVLAGPERSRAEELARGGQRLWAVGLAAVCGVARLQGHEGDLWESANGRFSRAREVLQAYAERRATTWMVVVCVGLTAGLFVHRWKRAPQGLGMMRPTRGAQVLGALVALWCLAEVQHVWSTTVRRDEVYAAMAPQFSLFLHLEPPSGATLPEPAPAPSLQLARDVFALDGQRIGLVSALGNSTSSAALALDLSHRLASSHGEGDAPEVQMSLMADRSHSWQVLQHALRVAYGVGVRRIEVLYTRGEGRLSLGPGAPPEAAYVLAKDFGAVRLTLSASEGLEFSPQERFSEVARRLAEQPRGAVLRVMGDR